MTGEKSYREGIDNQPGACRRTKSNDPDSAHLGEKPQHFMYVLSCVDGSFYTGYTVDVEKRIAMHNAGKGAKYTRSRTPVELIACARFETKHEAMSAEYRFKRLTRSQKDRLLRHATVAPFEEVLSALMPQVCSDSDDTEATGERYASAKASSNPRISRQSFNV